MIDVDAMSQDEVDAVWVGIHASETVLTGEDATVLSFDLGTRFGWAHVASDGSLLESGWYDTKRKGESPGMGRLRFKRALHDIVEATSPTAVYYENPQGAFRGHGGKVIMRQMGILEAELTEMEIPYGAVHQATLKKYATGRGNCSKDDMREALRDRLEAT